MSTFKNILAYFSSAAGGAVVANSATGGGVAFPAWAALFIVGMIVVGLVMIVYRITDKSDLVELVKAWRSPPSSTIDKNRKTMAKEGNSSRKGMIVIPASKERDNSTDQAAA